jgi:hypothetical protein
MILLKSVNCIDENNIIGLNRKTKKINENIDNIKKYEMLH